MKFSAAFFVSSALLLPTLGARLPIKIPTGPVKTDSYIVTLKSSASKSAHLDGLLKIAARDSASSTKVTHDYDLVLHGYAAILTGSALQHVLTSADVAAVEADGIASINFDVNETRDNSVGPMERAISARAETGAGTRIYGIDTGIYTAHTTFGGRASWGATYGGYAYADGNGHGTHTAGTAVGTSYGIATSATIVAVKVLSDSGSGAYSDVISGVNYAYTTFLSNGIPSIATMSLSGGISTALDSSIQAAIAGGLHFTIAAGNSNVDASTASPGDVVEAVTVGAVTGSTKAKASFSNYGSILDIWAPGVDIVSAYIGSTTATATLSGTSMATPYVAGILAVALGKYGQMSPASLISSLKSHAQAVVTGAPSDTTNLFAVLW